jgi:hypothetical protein
MSMCADIGTRCLGALDNLTLFKRVATKWNKPWAEENDEGHLYRVHLGDQKERWTAADALASTTVRAAEHNSETDTEECQVRESSQSQDKSSQGSLIGPPVKFKQPPATSFQDPQISCYTSQYESRQAISNNNLYISECKKQSEATSNEVYKRNYNMTAKCLTAYNEELERLYSSEEPADEDGSLKDS